MTLTDAPRIADGTFTFKSQTLSDLLLEEYPAHDVTITLEQEAALSHFEYDFELSTTPFLRHADGGRIAATYRDDRDPGLLYDMEVGEDGSVSELHTLDGDRSGWVRSTYIFEASDNQPAGDRRSVPLTAKQSSIVSSIDGGAPAFVAAKTDEHGVATVLVVHQEDAILTHEITVDRAGKITSASRFRVDMYDQAAWVPTSRAVVNRLMSSGA